ncbi:hypothetical protein [Ensifer sp. LBL]|uniref:hypothetical protein n=1 Tax=Ensifer sp. LBL TaxID=2991056 RepID=UPI003D1D6822
MSNDGMVTRVGFADPDWRVGLTCHVEIDVKGEKEPAVLKEAARVLRDLAGKLEADSLETGFHKLTALDGTEWGEVYLDHYAETI